jgi:predicted nucleic acid-binding protein
MLKPRVYVETTIPSAYFDTRPEPEMVARRRWTRRWWDSAAEQYTLLSSEAVLDELRRGEPSRAADRLGLLQDLPLLEVDPVVGQIVAAYARHRLMPAKPGGDALHLALASYHKCDFLVTWNCQHLANANKFGHIRVVNTLLGLFVPALVTPLQLLGGKDEPAGEESNGGGAGER